MPGRESTQIIDPEVRLVGCIALDGNAWLLASKLPAECFRIDQCRQFWQACTELDLEGEIIDLPFILERMRRNGHEPNQEFICRAMDITPTAKLAGEYARLVEKQYRASRLGELGEQLSGMTLLADPEAMQELILTETEKLGRESSDALVSSQAALSGFMEELSCRDDTAADCISTGYRKLDELLGGGMVNAGLYLLAARPGVGKTSLALNIAENVGALHGVLYVSLEMSLRQITARRLAAASNVPGRELLMGPRISDEKLEKVRRGYRMLSKSHMSVNSRPAASVAEILRMARSIPDLRLIVVDYLGLVTPPGESGSRYEKTSEISNSLKRLAITLNIPVLALCQLSRECERRDSRRPELSDLRDSGSLEQDADGVIMLYRDDYYSGKTSHPGAPSMLECILRKNRHAGCGSIRMKAFLPTNIIAQME